MAQALEVKDLCKTYIVNKRQNNVLKNVNFTIQQGEMTAIMGPSGSGKSTLLYSVSGMDRPTSGTVWLGEREITAVGDKELTTMRLNDMGFIFQQMYMVKNLSIMDNILLPAFESHTKIKDRKELTAYCKELMRKLEISEIADNDITEVSGGQLQRACICRSVINNPEIIFADEPTGALNRSASEEVMKMLTLLNREGKTIMLVTHDIKVAAKCSRVLYIVDGNIKGEYIPDDGKEVESDKERERKLSNWLNDMGW